MDVETESVKFKVLIVTSVVILEVDHLVGDAIPGIVIAQPPEVQVGVALAGHVAVSVGYYRMSQSIGVIIIAIITTAADRHKHWHLSVQTGEKRVVEVRQPGIHVCRHISVRIVGRIDIVPYKCSGLVAEQGLHPFGQKLKRSRPRPRHPVHSYGHGDVVRQHSHGLPRRF